MQIRRLTIEHWRQFETVSIDFHQQLTVLTGANGAGKTTILNMLSRLIGWSVALLAVPKEDRERLADQLPKLPFAWRQPEEPVGVVELASGEVVSLRINDEIPQLSQSYGPVFGLNGLYITSHQKMFSYYHVKTIPTSVSAAEQLLRLYTERARNSFMETKEQELIRASETPSVRLKESLISLAVFGEGNNIVSPNSDSLETFRGFEDVLRIVLPEEIGFQRFFIKMPEVYLIGRSGAFPIEALSGGAMAIVDLAWQVYLASRVYDDYLVLIDEPENHLHPSLQRRLLSNLLVAFPKAQFVISTHSPLMITSVEQSAVYVLSQSAPGSFVSSRLDLINRSASAEATLYDVLGVDGSTPVWAERRISEIVGKYEGRNDADSVSAMRDELRAAGLADRVTEVISKILDRDRDPTR